jgi:hypothetical protein
LTHVLAAEINTQKHAEKAEVARHLCGIHLCVNPDHIKFGTRSENALDSIKHGTGKSKLTEQQVREIRATYKTDKTSRADRATKYNVTTEVMKCVETNRTWRHLL